LVWFFKIRFFLRWLGDINPTNYKQHCQIQNCFVYDNITNYLNQAAVKALLHVPANVTWQTCNFDVQFTAEDAMDGVANGEIAKILDQSAVRVLIYYGACRRCCCCCCCCFWWWSCCVLSVLM
jgi:hypothetical protein